MKVFPHFIILLSVVLVGCTDLSKVDKKDKKDPLESIAKEEEKADMVPDSAATEAEVGEGVEGEDASPNPSDSPIAKDTSPDPFAYPFDRVIEDQGGRKIDVVIMAKQDGKIGFQRNGSYQRFIMPVSNLSEGDQAFLSELNDGGDISKIEDSLARAVKFSGRAATWYREIVRAEKEAEALGIPRLTAIMIIGDSSSSRIENKLLYAPEFRSWAGKHLALCLIRVEPKTSRMAMTDEMTENRRVAKLYGVRERPALMLNIAGDSMGLSVPLTKIETVDDLIREIQIVLDKPSKAKAYIESKDAPK